MSHYGILKPLMGKRIKVEVIREHWDEIVRLVASLKAATVLPPTMLRKLAAYERQNQLDLALQEVGRVERTLFMLDWLESAALRRRCQAGLNLIITAIVYWNSTYIADAVAHLRDAGEDVSDELLMHTSPVGWNHIAFSGDFLWERAAATLVDRRELNYAPLRIAA